jgi:hypothetical protein
MPLIKFKNKTFMLRWKPEFDIQLLVIASIFREGCVKCSKRPQINWKKAEGLNFLKGLPKNLSRQDLSHRVSQLLRTKFNPEGSAKRKTYNRTHPTIVGENKSFENKKEVFQKDVSPSLQKSFGYKPKRKWSPIQEKLLMYLVKKYRKGAMSINWKVLMKDPFIKNLPSNYTLPRLRSFYWTYLKRTMDPKTLVKRRKAAIAYKKKNYKIFLKSQKRNRKIVNNTVNSFLQEKLEIR